MSECVRPEVDLLDVGVVGAVDELLQLSQAVGLGEGEYQLRLHVGLPGLLTSHLEELHQVLPVACGPACTSSSGPT